MLKALALTTALLAAPAWAATPATTAAAPAAPAATLTPNQQQARLQKQNATMTKAAVQAAQLVDAGKVGEVWDGGSTVMKALVKRDAFVAAVAADRAKAGAVTGRKLLAISRTHSEGGKTPAGDYINVNFATTFASMAKPVRELVSFHLDQDKVWRVSGYTLR